MARAKKTDRADARRRYRASIEPVAVATADESGIATPNRLTRETGANQLSGAGAPAKSGRPGDPLATAPVARRPGFFGAMSGAITPLDLRADLAALPALTLRTKAVWVPALLVLIATIAILIPSVRENGIVALIVPVVLVPPPLGAPFLAGILAPRAGWLAGGIAGLLAGIGYSIYVGTVDVSASSQAITQADRINAIVQAMIISPVSGVLFGSFAAFYKRFLRLSNPNAGRRPPAKSSARPGQRTARPATARRR